MSEMLMKTAQALTARGFEAHVFSTAKEAADFVLADIPHRHTVAVGGSMTIKEMGLQTLLRDRGNTVLWHWETAPADRPALLHEAMNADSYLASVNALTESGLIVQIDGTGNRVGALCYGPKSVYLLVGKNKLVLGGYAQALARVKQVACPKNARRLGLDTPCAKNDRCDAAACTHSMCAVTACFERAPGGKRTVVVLVDENLGY